MVRRLARGVASVAILALPGVAAASAPSCPDEPAWRFPFPSLPAGIVHDSSIVRLVCAGDASDAQCTLTWRAEVTNDSDETREVVLGVLSPDAVSRTPTRIEPGASAAMVEETSLVPAAGRNHFPVLAWIVEARHLLFSPDWDDDYRRIAFAPPPRGSLQVIVSVPETWEVVGGGHEEPHCDRGRRPSARPDEQRPGRRLVTWTVTASGDEDPLGRDGLGGHSGPADEGPAGVTFELPYPPVRLLGPTIGFHLRGAEGPFGVHFALDIGIRRWLWATAAVEWDDRALHLVPSLQAGLPATVFLMGLAPYATVAAAVRLHDGFDASLRLGAGWAAGPVDVVLFADLWAGVGDRLARVEPGLAIRLSL